MAVVISQWTLPLTLFLYVRYIDGMKCVSSSHPLPSPPHSTDRNAVGRILPPRLHRLVAYDHALDPRRHKCGCRVGRF